MANDREVSFEESVRLQLEMNAEQRAIPGSYAAREQERVEAARKKAREAKERRRARNPYDFS